MCWFRRIGKAPFSTNSNFLHHDCARNHLGSPKVQAFGSALKMDNYPLLDDSTLDGKAIKSSES
jgi:hypothetical protein